MACKQTLEIQICYTASMKQQRLSLVEGTKNALAEQPYLQSLTWMFEAVKPLMTARHFDNIVTMAE